MPLLMRILISGSVTPLMYGKTAKPFLESGGSVHLKNIPTHSSGEGMTSEVEVISFTIEIENNGQISFLDTLITRKNGAITIGVYQKPTHIDRCLDFNSHHELKHKISTASTLLNLALNLPSTAEGVRKELTHVSNTLKSNGYPSAAISSILKKNFLTFQFI